MEESNLLGKLTTIKGDVIEGVLAEKDQDVYDDLDTFIEYLEEKFGKDLGGFNIPRTFHNMQGSMRKKQAIRVKLNGKVIGFMYMVIIDIIPTHITSVVIYFNTKIPQSLFMLYFAEKYWHDDTITSFQPFFGLHYKFRSLVTEESFRKYELLPEEHKLYIDRPKLKQRMKKLHKRYIKKE